MMTRSESVGNDRSPFTGMVRLCFGFLIAISVTSLVFAFVSGCSRTSLADVDGIGVNGADSTPSDVSHRRRPAFPISSSWSGAAQDLAARLDFTNWEQGDGTVNYGLALEWSELAGLEDTTVWADRFGVLMMDVAHSSLRARNPGDEDLAAPSSTPPDIGRLLRTRLAFLRHQDWNDGEIMIEIEMSDTLSQAHRRLLTLARHHERQRPTSGYRAEYQAGLIHGLGDANVTPSADDIAASRPVWLVRFVRRNVVVSVQRRGFTTRSGPSAHEVAHAIDDLIVSSEMICDEEDIDLHRITGTGSSYRTTLKRTGKDGEKGDACLEFTRFTLSVNGLEPGECVDFIHHTRGLNVHPENGLIGESELAANGATVGTNWLWVPIIHKPTMRYGVIVQEITVENR